MGAWRFVHSKSELFGSNKNIWLKRKIYFKNLTIQPLFAFYKSTYLTFFNLPRPATATATA